jgi:hypothetical protein
MPDLRGLDPIAVARLVVGAAAYRALNGTGPTWSEACRAAGWTGLGYEARGRRFAAIRRAGLITYSREPRSLEATPAGRRWALATLSRERAIRRRELA